MNYNTVFRLVCSMRIVQCGGYGVLPPCGDSLPCQTSPNRSHGWRRFRSKGSGLRVSSQLGYTSTPLMREPSKTIVKSWMVCRMRMRELTVMRSRRRALSSYIRVMAGHSANSGIHCGSRRSLQTQTETVLSTADVTAEQGTDWSFQREGVGRCGAGWGKI